MNPPLILQGSSIITTTDTIFPKRKRQESTASAVLIDLYGKTIADKIIKKSSKRIKLSVEQKKTEIKIDFSAYFPEEVTQVILSHIDYKSLTRAMQTCSMLHYLGSDSVVYHKALKDFLLKQALKNANDLEPELKELILLKIFKSLIETKELEKAIEVAKELPCLKKAEAQCMIAVLKSQQGLGTAQELLLNDVQSHACVNSQKIDSLIKIADSQIDQKNLNFAALVLHKAWSILISSDEPRPKGPGFRGLDETSYYLTKFIAVQYRLNPERAKELLSSLDPSFERLAEAKLYILKMEAKKHLSEVIQKVEEEYTGAKKIEAILDIADEMTKTDREVALSLLLDIQKLFFSSKPLKPGPSGPGSSTPNLGGVRNSPQIIPRPLGRGSFPDEELISLRQRLVITIALIDHDRGINLIPQQLTNKQNQVDTYQNIAANLTKIDKALAVETLRKAYSLCNQEDFPFRNCYKIASLLSSMLDETAAKDFFIEILNSKDFPSALLNFSNLPQTLDESVSDALFSALDRSWDKYEQFYFVPQTIHQEKLNFIEALASFAPYSTLQMAQDFNLADGAYTVITSLAKQDTVAAVKAIEENFTGDFEKARAYAKLLRLPIQT